MTALACAQRLNQLWRLAILGGDVLSAEALLCALASAVLLLPEADFRAYLAWCESLLAPAIPVVDAAQPRVITEADAS